MSRHRKHAARIAGAAVFFGLLSAPEARAQDGKETNPAAALSAALMAACRQNQIDFTAYLTAENAAAFRALPEAQRLAIVRRFALLDDPGRPIVTTDEQNHAVVRCDGRGTTVEFRFGASRTQENLSFIPVNVAGERTVEFGMVREGAGWRILSLGLLLVNIPELTKQWAEQDLAAREEAAIKTLRGIADAVKTYRGAFDKLPESLAQLGPAPKEGVSPDAAGLLEERLVAGNRGGYNFRYRILPAPDGGEPGFELAAAPEEYGRTGRRSFFLDAAGKLHAADKKGAPAGGDDPIPSSESSPEKSN
jgi:hypothetical protein